MDEKPLSPLFPVGVCVGGGEGGGSDYKWLVHYPYVGPVTQNASIFPQLPH